MPISQRAAKISISPTMKVSAKAKELKSQGIDVIDLSVGEPDFSTPDNIKGAAIEAINNNYTKYTVNKGILPLRNAISNKLMQDNGLDYSAENIVVSNGAKQSLYLAVLSLIDPGDEVIVPAPYWVSYPEMVGLADGKSVFVETLEINEFKLTPEEFKSAITDKTKLLILCNPSNPTGTAYLKEELELLAEVAFQNNIYVIADEIYEKLIYDDYEFNSFASIKKELLERVIVINGVSKAYSMTGWRIGYAASSSEIIKAMNNLQSHTTSNASSISQHAALEALSGNQNKIKDLRAEFEKRRNFLHGELNSINGINCFLPKGAFYLYPNIKELIGKSFSKHSISNSMDLSMYLLDEAKVAIVPGSAFGTEGYLRISYATSMENLIESVKRIKEAIEKLN